jgi:hypothetical protein
MNQITRLWRLPFAADVVITTLLAMVAGLVGAPVASAHTVSTGSCQLNSANGNIKHVIYIQFDNTHFTRDNPNVPSDLEQMPNLLNFIENNGVLLSKHHTPLIAHTATDILTSLTGVYGDSHGIPVANAFGYFNANGTDSFASSFGYWTDKLSASDPTYKMLTADGHNAPAPWVPFTRAGCNVGSVATANTILESTSDIATVFGAGSPEAMETFPKNQADFVGIGIHCAAGDLLCSAANHGRPDLLPDEPGGYTGYMGLFGHKYVAPQISPNGPLTDLDGNVIQDPNGNPGFPGFNGMEATVSLSYVAAMQEHNVPVTYAYISDAHDMEPNGPAFGPGQAGYVAALKAYDEAFGKFFTRLANDGINQSNTLFVFTADEGDHFVGGPPSPPNCNGVTIACTYSQIGELDASMPNLLSSQQGITAPFDIHSDSAPTVYVTGNPARTDALARTFERATGKLTVPNPITGQTVKLTNFLADPVEMKLLHMVTADPARTPTYTLFADPNYFVCNQFSSGCPTTPPFVKEEAGFAWNHGDVAPEINTTWLGLVGPGVEHNGVDSTTWSDHTDIRPTMLALLGLKDDYAHAGRVLFEDLDPSALPQSLNVNRQTLTLLAQVYKQINAPVGQLGLASLRISTRAEESGNASNDVVYSVLDNQLIRITNSRNTIAAQMSALLESAAFDNTPIDLVSATKLIAEGNALLIGVNVLAR